VEEIDAMAMARDERAEMADFLASLRPEQWDRPSLCAGWRIRDVAAHVVSYEEHDGGRGPGEAVLMVLAGRRNAARGLEGPGASSLQQRLG